MTPSIADTETATHNTTTNIIIPDDNAQPPSPLTRPPKEDDAPITPERPPSPATLTDSTDSSAGSEFIPSPPVSERGSPYSLARQGRLPFKQVKPTPISSTKSNTKSKSASKFKAYAGQEILDSKPYFQALDDGYRVAQPQPDSESESESVSRSDEDNYFASARKRPSPTKGRAKANGNRTGKKIKANAKSGNGGSSSKATGGSSKLGKGNAWTGDEDWTMFTLLHPKVDKADWRKVGEAVGRDAKSCQNRYAIMGKRLEGLIKGMSGSAATAA